MLGIVLLAVRLTSVQVMEGVSQHLMKKSSPSGLTYIAEWNGANSFDKMDHLVCAIITVAVLMSVSYYCIRNISVIYYVWFLVVIIMCYYGRLG